MSESIRRKILLSVFLPLPLLAFLCAVLVWQLSRWQDETRWVDHTREVLTQVHLAQRLLTDQETGLRGYLLTKELSYLEPYKTGSAEFPAALDELRRLVSDRQAQRDRVQRLEEQYSVWHNNAAGAAAGITASSNEVVNAIRARKPLMDHMRELLRDLIGEEASLLERRRDAADAAWQTALIGTVGVVIGVGVLLVVLIRRIVARIDSVYKAAIDDRERSLSGEKQARTAAEAIAEEIRERSREMERVFVDVRTQRDQAVTRLAELEKANS